MTFYHINQNKSEELLKGCNFLINKLQHRYFQNGKYDEIFEILTIGLLNVNVSS